MNGEANRNLFFLSNLINISFFLYINLFELIIILFQFESGCIVELYFNFAMNHTNLTFNEEDDDLINSPKFKIVIGTFWSLLSLLGILGKQICSI